MQVMGHGIAGTTMEKFRALEQENSTSTRLFRLDYTTTRAICLEVAPPAKLECIRCIG